MICLLAKSCGGKNAVAEELIKMGYEKLVTYTTRPIRPGERDGYDYNFIKMEEFLVKSKADFFSETNFYNTKTGMHFYGSAAEDYKRLRQNDKSFVILEPDGMKKVKGKGEKITTFYLDVSEDVIIRRQVGRHDDPNEAERRFRADKRDFEGIESKVDFIVNNEDKTPYETAKLIDKLYRGGVANDSTRVS